MATVYLAVGRYVEAETLFSTELECEKRVMGPANPDTLLAMYNFACLGAANGRVILGMSWLRQAVDLGFSVADSIASDSQLKNHHGPESDSLVEKARRNAAAARAPVTH